MIYLASPYSHPDPAVRQRRHDQVAGYAARIVRAGLPVFCPITHSHPMHHFGGLDYQWETWRAIDVAIVSGPATVIAVLCLDGWEASRGIRHELQLATERGLVPYFIHTEVDPERIVCTLGQLHREANP